MLTHIHPSLLWFTCEDRPIFNGLVRPGSVSRTSQGPPRAQSPFARSRRYLNRRDLACITSEGVTPPSSLLRTHAPDQNPPAHFDSTYKAGSLQVVASPCWEMVLPDVISAILAQVPGPLPRDASLVPLSVSSQKVTASPALHKVRHIQANRRNATSTTTLFRGGSHFVMFRLPCLLAPQVAPTAQGLNPVGSQGVYATQWTGGCPPKLWYRYMTESDNYHGGTLTRWIAALSAATCNVRVSLCR